MNELLHLETVRERIKEIKEKLGTMPRLSIEDVEYLLGVVERTIESGDTTELEEWAR